MSTFKQLTPCLSNLSRGSPFCLLLSGDYRYLRFRSISVFTAMKTAVQSQYHESGKAPIVLHIFTLLEMMIFFLNPPDHIYF